MTCSNQKSNEGLVTSILCIHSRLWSRLCIHSFGMPEVRAPSCLSEGHTADPGPGSWPAEAPLQHLRPSGGAAAGNNKPPTARVYQEIHWAAAAGDGQHASRTCQDLSRAETRLRGPALKHQAMAPRLLPRGPGPRLLLQAQPSPSMPFFLLILLLLPLSSSSRFPNSPSPLTRTQLPPMSPHQRQLERLHLKMYMNIYLPIHQTVYTSNCRMCPVQRQTPKHKSE